ncbi:hypothetical protein D3C81_2300340 [compost metagenome]
MLFYRLTGVFEFCITGQHNNPDMLPAAADRGDQFNTRDFRHIDVSDYNVDGIALKQL